MFTNTAVCARFFSVRTSAIKFNVDNLQSITFYRASALHGMQTRFSNDNSVCPSVRPSFKRVNCDKTEEKSVQIFIPYERSFSLVL